MDPSDPNSRALRGSISVAVRAGDAESEAELRHELALCNIERAFAQHLDGGRPLTVVEVRRLRLVLESYAAARAKSPGPVADGVSA